MLRFTPYPLPLPFSPSPVTPCSRMYNKSLVLSNGHLPLLRRNPQRPHLLFPPSPPIFPLPFPLSHQSHVQQVPRPQQEPSATLIPLTHMISSSLFPFRPQLQPISRMYNNRMYNKSLVLSKDPLPHYRPELDSRRPQRQ
ncbi:unnamed protein product, partial [Closterium sp. NIES-54]